MSRNRITHYDPNIFPAIITYRLIFMQWGYSSTAEVTARYHVRGFSALDAALDNYANSLPDDGQIILADGNGRTLEVCLADENSFDFTEALKGMLVAAEIVSVKPYHEGR